MNFPAPHNFNIALETLQKWFPQVIEILHDLSPAPKFKLRVRGRVTCKPTKLSADRSCRISIINSTLCSGVLFSPRALSKQCVDSDSVSKQGWAGLSLERAGVLTKKHSCFERAVSPSCLQGALPAGSFGRIDAYMYPQTFSEQHSACLSVRHRYLECCSAAASKYSLKGNATRHPPGCSGARAWHEAQTWQQIA